MADIRDAMNKIKDVGTPENKFFKGDFAVGTDYTEEEKLSFFKDKKYALVSLEIKAKSSNTPFTLLVDDFALHLERGKISENVAIISNKLQNLIPQIEVLIKKWTEEMGK